MKQTLKLSTAGASASAGAGIFAAIAASACCIIPAILAIVGAGSIGAFSMLTAYRPYLIALSIVVLGLAFYLTYRKREVRCVDGMCKIESAGKWNKISVWAAAVIAVVAMGFPYLSSAMSPAVPPNAGQTILDTARAPRLSTAIISIKGMDCAACARGLQGTLQAVPGVSKAAIDYGKAQACVKFNPTTVKPDSLVAVLNDAGYPSKLTKLTN